MQFIRRSVTVSLALLVAACTSAPPVKPPVVMPPPVQPKPAEPVVVQPPPPPPPTPLFTPGSYADLPGWQQDNLREAWPAFMASCSVLVRKADWAEPCTVAKAVDPADEAGIRGYFEANFVPNRVRAPDGADTGLITGYYEAMLHGQRKRGGKYQTPLYRVPDDLITVDLASVYPQLKNMRLRGRLAGKKLVPYSTREQIERSGFTGKELLWVDDPVEAFFLEVQGSGRVQLDDTGETVRVGYADQNGYPYKAIGRWLVDQGEVPASQMSAQAIRAWIVAHPERRQELFNANPSYIFFKEEKIPDPSVGPKGSLGVPLTPARSVAIDTSLLPPGAPIFLSTTLPASAEPLQRLVMGQDTGGAIRGAVRADFFFGFGPQAAENAGLMKQTGALWVLLPKALTVATSARR